MRLVKTFIERVTEKFVGNGWEVQPAADAPFENQFNSWVRKNGVRAEHVIMHEDADSGLMGDVRIRTFRYCAFYDADELAPEADTALPPLPPLDRPIWVPTVEVTLLEEGRLRKMFAMAGACGVPKGYKLGTADAEPAPAPLFSPDVDLRKYANLFRSTVDGSKSA